MINFWVNVPVMVTLPDVPAVVARPLLSITATFVLDELQFTNVLITCVLPSLKVATALNCEDPPRLMVGLGVVTVTNVRSAAVTVKLIVAGGKLPNFAVIVTGVADAPNALTIPLPLPTVAMVELDEDQTAFVVRS